MRLTDLNGKTLFIEETFVMDVYAVGPTTSGSARCRSAP